jgi:hypothetical protein
MHCPGTSRACSSKHVRRTEGTRKAIISDLPVDAQGHAQWHPGYALPVGGLVAGLRTSVWAFITDGRKVSVCVHTQELDRALRAIKTCGDLWRTGKRLMQEQAGQKNADATATNDTSTGKTTPTEPHKHLLGALLANGCSMTGRVQGSATPKTFPLSSSVALLSIAGKHCLSTFPRTNSWS